MTEEQIARFWAKVRKTETCWYWLGAISQTGYARFGAKHYAHRIAWELEHGTVLPTRAESNLSLDHLCRVRSCVNPAHMELIEQGENIRRGEKCNGEECPHGHPFPEFKRRRANGQHFCIACRREADRLRRKSA
jgi:hypothetical protein